MRNQKLLEILKVAHDELVDLAKKFPPDKRNTILFNKWSLHDILAHISAWNKIDAYHTERVRDGKNFEWIYDVDKFNEDEIEKRRHWVWNKIFEEFNQSGKYLIEIFQNLPDDVWDRTCGPDSKFSPQRFFEAQIKHYRDAHLPAVRKVFWEIS